MEEYWGLILTVLITVLVFWFFFGLARLLKSKRKDSQLSDTDLVNQLNERFASIERNLTSLLDERLDRSSQNVQQTLGDLRDRLGKIDILQDLITDLSGGVEGLRRVLAGSQGQGAFGEVQLERIVADVLPAQCYQFQYTLSNGRRADLILKLPDPPGSICVDSKFPVQSFREIQEADSKDKAAAARNRFKTAVRRHISDIASKYIIASETSDFALMFLPSEAVFLEIQGHHDDLIRESQNARVYIVSPTTMMATVNAIRGIVRDAELSKQAGQVRDALLKIGDDVENLEELARKLESHFDLTQRDVAQIIRRINATREKIVRLEELSTPAGERESHLE